MKKCTKRFSALVLAVALAVGSRGMSAIGAGQEPLFAHAEKNGTWGSVSWTAKLVSAGTIVTATTSSNMAARDEARLEAYGENALGNADHDFVVGSGQYFGSATISFANGVFRANSTHLLNSTQVTALSVQ